MRLTNAIRNDMLHAIMAKQFHPHAVTLNKECKALIKEAILELYQKEIAAVELIPEELRESMLLKTGGYRMRVKLEKNGNTQRCEFFSASVSRLVENMDIPVKYRFGTLREYYDPVFYVSEENNPELWNKIRDKQKEIHEYSQTMEAAGTQIMSVLKSATTDKKLLELAPEMQPFLPIELAPAASRSLISMDTINSVRAMLTPNTEKKK